MSNKCVVLKPFQKKYITREFVYCLNKKSINQFLNVRHKKQTMISAKKYLDDIYKNNYIYYAIFCEIKLIFFKYKIDNVGLTFINSFT